MDLEPGDAFGPFRIGGWLGRGATAVIYRATDASGRDVALKIMVPEVAAVGDNAAGFLREVAAVTRLRHRNIVVVYAHGVIEGSPYMAMELLTGASLAAALSRANEMSFDRRLDIVIQLCEALQFAHDHGVVHRDVKPANIWLLENGGVKLFDFGMAHVAGSSLTRMGDLVGSAAYMSPEQVSGSELDGRADVFGAGAVLYELLTGQRAFTGTNLAGVMHKILHAAPVPIASLNPEVPPEVAALVMKALEKRPADRFAEAADFETELRLARYRLGQVDARPPVVTDTVVMRQPAPPAPVVPAPAPTMVVPGPVQPTTVRPAPAVRPTVSPAPAPVPPAGRVSASGMGQLARLPGRRAAIALAGLALLAAAGVGLWRSRPAAPAIQVLVRSTPPDALIVIDGVDTGLRTPATLSLSSPPRRLQLALPGHATVDVVPDEPFDRGPVTLSYALVRRLRLESTPAGAAVTVDGRDTGLVTPVDVDLPSGEPVVEMRAGELYGRGEVTEDVHRQGALSLVLVRRAAQPSPPPVSAPGRPEVAGGPTMPASATKSAAVTIRGNYPFEVSGCGTSSPAAELHSLVVAAPCVLQVRAPAYLLDASLNVAALEGEQDLSVPQLARVELRSKLQDCTVVLGGRAFGNPTVYADVAAGTYTATIHCPDRTYSTGPLRIGPGRSSWRLDEFIR